MSSLDIGKETLQRLEDRALKELCSVDELINRLLNATPTTIVLPYQDMLRHTSDIITLFDLELHYLYVNQPIKAITGFSPEYMIGKTNRELGHAEALVVYWENMLHDVMITRQEKVIKFDFPTLVGRRFYETCVTPILNTHGDTQYVLTITRDITKRELAEQQLRQTEANLRAILNSTWQSFTLIDRNYRVIDVDEKGKKSAEAIFGKRIQPGDSIYDFVFAHDLTSFNVNFLSALNGQQITIEKTFQDLQGKILFFEVTYYPVVDNEGLTIGVCMGYQNTTERKQAQLALSKSEENYRFLAQHVTDMISRYTPEGVYTFVTPSAQVLLGYLPEELVGHSAYEFFHPEDLQAIQQSHQTVLEQPSISTVEYRVRRKDGVHIWFETTSRVVKDIVTGEPIEIIAVSRDISERKRAEETLRKSEASLKEAQAIAHLGSWEVDFQTGHTVWSDEFYRICGLEPGGVDPSLESGYLIIHPDDRAKTTEVFEQTRQSGRPYNIDERILRPDGEVRWVSLQAQVSFGSQNTPVRLAGTLLDITERKQVEDALSRSEARLRSLLDSQTAFVVRSDLNGFYTYVNPAFASRYSWLTDNLIGRSLTETVQTDDRDKALLAAEACMAKPGQSVQVVLRKTVPKEEMFWTLWEFVAIEGHDNIVTEIQCIGFDITQQVQADQLRLEQERLKANLKKEQQFNTLIQKAVSMLSHDVRIPLTVIGMAKDTLEHYFDRIDETKRREKLDSIGRQIRYVIELLDTVTMMVQGSFDNIIFKPEPLNLAVLCQIYIQEIQETIGINHQLVFTTDERITTAMIDETLVSRVLINLLSNAVKFSPETSEIRLELSLRESWIVLRVVDQGMGISEADQQHIFDPYYRTESAQHIWGTGLGLNIVKDCVEHHQGRIMVKSIVGQGTTFVIELPALYV